MHRPLGLAFALRLLAPALVAALALAPPEAAAATAAAPRKIHVATKGSDKNSGTLSSPLRSVARAVDVASAGDTILVHAGTYYGVVEIKNSGTAARPIVLMPAGDGKATLSASHPTASCRETSPTRDRTLQVLAGSDDWIVRDLEIVGGVMISGTDTPSLDKHIWNLGLPGRSVYDPSSSNRLLESLGSDPAENIQLIGNRITRRGIQATAATFGRIVNNEVSNIQCGTGAGILLTRFSDGWVIRGNFVHHNAESTEHPMEEGIRQSSGSNYNLVENNVLEDLAGRGRGVTTDVHAGWNVIRWNVTRRAYVGYNSQTGGVGNQWIQNTAVSNRRFGFHVDGKDYDQARPDENVPGQMVMRGNCSVNNPYDLNVGAVQQSAFSNNAFSSIRLSDNVRSYWSKEGNTYDGSSKPPPDNLPKRSCPSGAPRP